MTLSAREQKLLLALVVVIGFLGFWRFIQPSIQKGIVLRGEQQVIRRQIEEIDKTQTVTIPIARGGALPVFLQSIRASGLTVRSVQIAEQIAKEGDIDTRDVDLQLDGTHEQISSLFEKSRNENAGWHLIQFSIVEDRTGKSTMQLKVRIAEEQWKYELAPVAFHSASEHTSGASGAVLPLALQGIADTGGAQMAIINGALLEEGDSVEEYTVVRIRSTGVQLEKRGSKVWLPWQE